MRTFDNCYKSNNRQFPLFHLIFLIYQIILFYQDHSFKRGVCAMSEDIDVRWGWLKGMYIYTIVGAGGFGLGMIFIPDSLKSIFGWPNQDPVVFGVTGSVYLSFALLSILGLRSPLKFLPVLLLQLSYKVVWCIGVVLPLLVAGKFPMYGLLHIIIFATYIIGDLIAIPFPYVFAKQSDP
jgi:hypothetical protein